MSSPLHHLHQYPCDCLYATALTSRTLLDNCHWSPLDDVLCGLVGKLRTSGYDHALELGFRFESANFDPNLDCKGLLQKIREHDRVRIPVTSGERVLEIVVRIS